MFCQYKNVLGVPKQGIHSYRLFGFAVVDVVMTIIASYFISIGAQARGIKLEFWKSLLGLFLLGIFAHYIFCVETTVSKLLTS
jgi:hypothetical protein